MRKWQTIIFDLDDTLYPERDYALSGFRAVADWGAAQLGIPFTQGYAELAQLFKQGVRGDTFNRWLANYGYYSDSLARQLVKLYREHTPAIVPFPVVTTLLDLLKSNYRLGLVSDGYLDVQRRKWKALNLARYFDAVVFSDEWGRAAWKPSPKPFHAVLERLEADVSGAVYVADNPLKDFFGARQVGMYTIQIKLDDSEYVRAIPPTPQHSPDLVLLSFDALQRFFCNGKETC